MKARIVVALGALFPDDPRAQGAGRLRLPRAAPVSRPLRSDAAARGVAVDRQLLPRRRRHLAHPGLPRRRRAAGGHEPGALRLAERVGARARGHRAHARHRVQRQGNLRHVRRAGARSRPTRSSTSSASSATTWRTGAAPVEKFVRQFSY